VQFIMNIGTTVYKAFGYIIADRVVSEFKIQTEVVVSKPDKNDSGYPRSVVHFKNPSIFYIST
jgi:hypothetical protein